MLVKGVSEIEFVLLALQSRRWEVNVNRSSEPIEAGLRHLNGDV